MLCHFFHDERVADQESHHFRRVAPRLLAQNCALIVLHEHHQPNPTQTFTHDILELGEGPGTRACLREVDHVGLPDNGCAATASNGFEHLTSQPFDLYLLVVMMRLDLRSGGTVPRLLAIGDLYPTIHEQFRSRDVAAVSDVSLPSWIRPFCPKGSTRR
jgi:hypothetical protein